MANLQASRLFSVQDRVVVITGGGSGLGRIMARALDANNVSKVFVLGRREDALRETGAQAPNSSVIPVQCDITSKESLEAAYKTVASQTSHVDLLIANSGIMGPLMRHPPPAADGTLPSLSAVRDELFSVPMEEFSNVLNVNVTGSYYTVLAFLPLLEAANKRRNAPQAGVLSEPTAQVIITSSIAGFIRKVPFSYAYNASKSATTHLVKMLATNFAAYDIRFNGISPGLYYSDMADHIFSGAGIKDAGISDGSFPRDMIPATRGGSEEDLAGLILWLASASGGYVNGNILVTDGGRLSVVPAVY
ncbi:Short-chain dehydrogenase/reductase SDR [Penicillium alfredii]|uniref:Short-chain dehydrogenase/reductase SDR n=1 Tax=Penicillium alfredii TaxID=1506179 RepID=A0A9W9FKH4_9EURO|nr:Short-chain dehydrogenase/reductase SDR [Penicillium alfredii]KAJ5101832.1 Short-chain dehydrogenase/reductase SDR [Penicillium alfredii]